MFISEADLLLKCLCLSLGFLRVEIWLSTKHEGATRKSFCICLNGTKLNDHKGNYIFRKFIRLFIYLFNNRLVTLQILKAILVCWTEVSVF